MTLNLRKTSATQVLHYFINISVREEFIGCKIRELFIPPNFSWV